MAVLSEAKVESGEFRMRDGSEKGREVEVRT